jgi:hypothetical protein
MEVSIQVVGEWRLPSKLFLKSPEFDCFQFTNFQLFQHEVQRIAREESVYAKVAHETFASY